MTREATINFDHGSDTARIYAADPVIMRKLDNLALENACVQEKSRDEFGRRYKAWVKVIRPRQVSQETKV